VKQPLQRHQLVWLDEYGWFRVLAQAAGRRQPALDAAALACLEHWAERRWPLVVTRQACSPVEGGLDTPLLLGLPAPACWGRQALVVTASLLAVQRQAAFPAASDAGVQLAAAMQARWSTLCGDLAALGVAAQVYGSRGWQLITGMHYLHAQSDIDLLLPVANDAQADAACALLQHAQDSATLPGLRIDGELAFDNGAGVAWREWAAWRAGRARQLLVKRIAGVALEDAAPGLAAA
jgi:phosphoribosyl-dephospho-CoA transferase